MNSYEVEVAICENGYSLRFKDDTQRPHNTWYHEVYQTIDEVICRIRKFDDEVYKHKRIQETHND